MEEIRIISITAIDELTSSDLEAWHQFLQEVNDPRAVFQIPELYFESMTLEDRVKSLFSCLVFKQDRLVGLFSFKIQYVQKKLKFGHFDLYSFYCNEIRSIGSGLLLDCSEQETVNIRLSIIDILEQQATQYRAYVFFEAIEEKDLFFKFSSQTSRFTPYELDCSQTFHIRFQPSFEMFLKNKSKSKRHSIIFNFLRLRAMASLSLFAYI